MIAITVSIIVITFALLLLLISSSLVFIRKGKMNCSTLKKGVYCKTNKNKDKISCYKVNENGFSTEGAENCKDAINCVTVYNECASQNLRDMMKNII